MRLHRGSTAVFSFLLAAGVALATAPGCGNEGGSSFDDGKSKPNEGTTPEAGAPYDPNNPFDQGGGIGATSAGPGGGQTGNPADAASCATAQAEAGIVPVYMLFVLDGSGSMVYNDDGVTENYKWSSAQKAFQTFFKQTHDKNDTNLGVGLILFSGNLGSSYPATGDVPDTKMIDDAQLAKLNARIGIDAPEGGTPTNAVMNACYPRMQKFKTEASGPTDTTFAQQWANTYGALKPGGKKVIVLASDGVPSDGSILNPNALPTLAKTNFTNNEIMTFAIGIGPFPSTDSGYDPALMGRIAQAGGTGPANCNPASTSLSSICHFQVTPGGDANKIAADLLAAIDKIRKTAAGCEYTLNASGGNIDPSKVNVTVKDGTKPETPSKKDPTTGWTYDDDTNPTRVILHGQICETVKNSDTVKVNIVLGCATNVGVN